MNFFDEPLTLSEQLDLFWQKVQADWYEFTALGLPAKVKYWTQVGFFKLGLSDEPVDKFYHPETEWDFDFTDNE